MILYSNIWNHLASWVWHKTTFDDEALVLGEMPMKRYSRFHRLQIAQFRSGSTCYRPIYGLNRNVQFFLLKIIIISYLKRYNYVQIVLIRYRPVSWGCRIRWLHLCRGVKPPQRGYLLAVGGDPWCLRTGSWWLSSTWPENRVVESLATHHFGPYWARRAVGEARSDQSAGHDSTLLDF